MPPIDVSKLGPLLRSWREAQGCGHFQWGFRLWLHGSHYSPRRMARILANAERTGQWADTDPAVSPTHSLERFEKAARRALAHTSDDQSRCDAVLAACVRAMIKHFDN